MKLTHFFPISTQNTQKYAQNKEEKSIDWQYIKNTPFPPGTLHFFWIDNFVIKISPSKNFEVLKVVQKFSVEISKKFTYDFIKKLL